MRLGLADEGNKRGSLVLPEQVSNGLKHVHALLVPNTDIVIQIHMEAKLSSAFVG